MFRRTLLAGLLLTGWAHALPEGGQVIHGQIQLQGNGNILQILQSSPQGIINWSSFNISPQELVRFLQPQQGVTLNRVTGSQASLIEGMLQANGSIFLLNPNGILFTSTAQVNTGSLVASTLSMSDSDFLQGKYHLLQAPGIPMAAVVNQGKLEVGEGGYLVLSAPLIHNEGLIVARQGQISLGASSQATLSFDAQGLLSVTIPDGWRGAQAQEAQTVLLTRGQLTDSLSQVLATPASPEAISLPLASGILSNSGVISADGSQGGRVTLNSSQLTANLASGTISANALESGGQGGHLEILSAGTAFSSGQLQARGGGFVELSGQSPQLLRAPDVSGGLASSGVVLLDPTSVEIVNLAGSFDSFVPDVRNGNGGGRPQGVGTVSVQALEAVSSGTIRLEATSSILWNVVPSDGALDLQPGVNLSMTSGGTLLAGAGQLIRANGGNVDLSSAGDMTAPGVQVRNGDLSLNSDAGRIKLEGNLSAERITLNAPAGSIYTQGHVVTGGSGGVKVDTLNLLGASQVGPGGVATINTTGQLDLGIFGPNDANAGAAARVQGTQADFVLRQNSQSGDVYRNGVLVNDRSVSGGGAGGNSEVETESNSGGQHSSLENEVETELRRSGQDLRGLASQSTSQQLLSTGTYWVPSPNSHDHASLLPVSNPSLSSPTFVPLYTLQLVSPQVVDTRGDFWQAFIEDFILWVEPEEESRIEKKP
ncbi:filamentous hemagglutinin N-terminal domain-containing protein [bacterium]|nr:filamentous hemagglutinin N-terminal domain-containing protein [bacterium]